MTAVHRVGAPVTGLESLFLHLESRRTPMHVGTIAVFEGRPLCTADGRMRVGDLRAQMLGRLHLAPRLRQRPSHSRFGLTARHWEDDPAFDIANHVRVTALPEPGGARELFDVCADLLSVPLEMDRPLWELWCVEGLAHGRVAIVQKLHHAVADGLGGVDLALAMLDTDRHPRGPSPGGQDAAAPVVHPAVPTQSVPTQAVPTQSVQTQSVQTQSVLPQPPRGAAGMHAGIEALSGALRHPAALWRQASALGRGMGSLVSVCAGAPAVSVNRRVGSRRRLAACSRPDAALHERAHELGVTFNDVLLAGVTGGMRTLLLGRGEEVAGRSLQVLVPVGHPSHDAARLGNDVSALVVRLPLDVADPLRLLGSVAEVVGRAKDDRQDAAGDALMDVLDHVPGPAMSAVSAFVHHQPFVNVVVTDVPGPPAPLYCLGARMLEVIPFVPLAGNLSVGVAAFTYNGRLTVGLQADWDHGRDVEDLASGIDRTLARLARHTRRSQAALHRVA